MQAESRGSTLQPQHSFSQRLFRGEATLQFWNAAAKGLGLINSFIVLAVLSVYQFGLYQLVLAAITIADSFSTGLFDDIVSNDLARGIAEGRPGEARRLFNEFALFKALTGLALGAVLFFGADAVAAYYGADIGVFVRIASFLAVLNALRAVLEAFFVATVALSGMAVETVQEAAKLAILGSFLALGPFGIREALLAAVGAATIAFLFAVLFFLRRYQTFFRGVASVRESMLRRAAASYGWLIYIRYGFAKAYKGITPWLIRLLLNTEAVALYVLALNLITLAQSIFPVAMLGRLMPWEAKDPARFRYILARSVKYVLWGGALLGIVLFFVAPPLTGLILPKYLPAMPVFKLFLVTLPLYGIYKIHKSALTVLREQGILTTRLVTEALGVTLLYFILIPLFGLPGAASAVVLAYAWRVWLLAGGLRRTHPELTIKIASLFRFDADDLSVLRKVAREAILPFRRLFASGSVL